MTSIEPKRVFGGEGAMTGILLKPVLNPSASGIL